MSGTVAGTMDGTARDTPLRLAPSQVSQILCLESGGGGCGRRLGLATLPFAVATGGWPYYYGYPYYGYPYYY